MSLTTEGGLPVTPEQSQTEIRALASLLNELDFENMPSIECAERIIREVREGRLAIAAPSQPVVDIADEMVEAAIDAHAMALEKQIVGANSVGYHSTAYLRQMECMRAALTAALTPPPSKDGG